MLQPHLLILAGRRVFTDEQQEVLEIEYENEAYPNIVRREYLAHRLGTSVRRISIWFQNKRQRNKTKGRRDTG